MAARREFWSGPAGFILANIAAAVGLGSIWKFPYEVGTNGGSAFVFCYLIGLGLVVLPLMLAELAIGRAGRSDAIGSIVAVASAARTTPYWSLIALLGVVTGFLILSFYSVIGGWTIAYLLETVRTGLPAGGAESAQLRFDALLGSPLRLLAYHSVFMAITALIVAGGIAHGIEGASKILMPCLVVLMAMLALYSVVQGDLAASLRYLFAFDLAAITPKIALEALGLGFFSIGVGFSMLITYAAYATPDIDLKQVAIVTIVADTLISLLAGFAVFPIVFAENLDPSSGPGLVFVTLPLAFAGMPFGTAAAAAFFLLLLVAALGSAISLLELATAPLRTAFGWPPALASAIGAAACWLVGIATVLSFNRWADWFPLAPVPQFATATWFDLLDHVTSNLFLPVAGFGLAVFVGWRLPEALIGGQLGLTGSAVRGLQFLLRYVVPPGIAAATLVPLMR
jgi:NSS family neurotransmitter:Na+ symporter